MSVSRKIGENGANPHVPCIGVVIADRHPVVLQGLASILGHESDFRVLASCTDGPACLEAIRTFAPDIAILDISMPGPTGHEILSVVSSEGRSTKVVYFTESVQESEVATLATADAYGVLSKNVSPEILVRSLRQISCGLRLSTIAAAEQEVQREQVAIT